MVILCPNSLGWVPKFSCLTKAPTFTAVLKPDHAEWACAVTVWAALPQISSFTWGGSCKVF